MTLAQLAAIPAIGVFLFATSLAAGPAAGAGLVVAALLAWLFFVYPIMGLGLMILAGTSLQVLGSEHLTGLPTSIGKAAGALTLIAWLARTFAYRTPLTYSPQIFGLGAFAACLVLSAARATDSATALDGVFRYAQLFLLFLMLASIAGEAARWLDSACVILTASMVLSAAIGFLEFFLPSLALDFDDPDLIKGTVGAIIDSDSFDGLDLKRITGGLSDSNWFAFTLASVLPLNLYLFQRYRGLGLRALVLGATALQSAGIVLSFTRSALLSLAMAALVLLIRRRLPLAPFALAAALGAAVFVVWNPPGLERIFSTEYLRAGSTPFRESLLRGGIALGLERPLLGYGYVQFGPAYVDWLKGQQPHQAVQSWEREFERRSAQGLERAEHITPHNTAIQLWVEFGLVGLAAFAFFVGSIVRDLSVARRYGSRLQGVLADCLLAGTAAFVVSAMFGAVAMLKVVWILGGLAAALRRVALVGDATPAVARPVPPGAPAALKGET